MNRMVASICLLLAHGLTVSACAQAPVTRTVPDAEVAATPLELPAVDLTADLLYRILAAELAAQRGMVDIAGPTLLALARETQDPRLAQRALEIAVARRDVSGAHAAAQQWLRLAPDDPAAESTAWMLAAASGQTEGLAEALTRRIVQIEDKDEAIRQTLKIVNQMREKRAALHVLEAVLLPVLGDHVTAQFALSDAAWAAKDASAALRYAQQAQQLAPSSGEAAQRILAYGALADPDTALAQTRAFLKTYPQARQVHFALVSHLSEQGAVDEALRHLQAMRQQYPEDFEVLYTQAHVHIRAQQYAQARATLAAIAPQNERERVALVSAMSALYRDSGRIDAAVEVLEQALHQASGALELQYELALLYERQGRLDDFEARLNYILQIDPDHVHANNALGYTWVDRNVRLGEAHILLMRAELLDPDNPYVVDSIGWYYYRRGDLAQAESYLQRAYTAMPVADVAAHLGEVLWMQNKTDAARAIWQAGLRLDPDNETLGKTLQRLNVRLP